MTGIDRIKAERERQITQEGWTAEHDAQHVNEELLDAAACYLFNAMTDGDVDEEIWPWDTGWEKREQLDDIRSLEIAGALIAAEIDRRLLSRKEEA